jgi:hypothetical protein
VRRERRCGLLTICLKGQVYGALTGFAPLCSILTQFTMYSIFNATIILLFCVIQNPSDPVNDELIQDAEYGRKTIQELTGRSLTATRCFSLITVLVLNDPLND